MADHILDKGMLFQGTGAVEAFRFVKPGTVAQSCDAMTAVGAAAAGVVQENVDAAKAATGNVVVNVRVLGVSRVVASAAIAARARVASAADGRAVTAALGNIPMGVALTAAAAAGDQIEVLLTHNLPAQA